MLDFSIMTIIIAVIICWLGYLIYKNNLFPEKNGKINYKSLNSFEHQKQEKVYLNQNDNNKENNNLERKIDGNHKFGNNKNNEKSQNSNNDLIREIETRMDMIERENKKMKEELNLTDLKAIILDQKINILTNKNNMFLNAYKILYFRKIANILLEKIFTNNKNIFYKTDCVFKHTDKEKCNLKVNYFPIIIAKENIGNFSINIINLLIDYLMYIKDFTSSFIHIVKKFPIQIEILFSLFGDYNIKKDANDYYLIDASILINAIFGDNIQEKKDATKEKIKATKIKKEEEIEEVTKENNIPKEISKDPKDKDKDVKEKMEGNLKGIKIKNKNNNGDMNGNINLSTNMLTGNEESEEKYNITENNDIMIINEEQIIKRNLMKKIDNIITSLKKNNHNFSENYIIKQINKLNLEKLLEKEDMFNKNELLKIKYIKELRDIIKKIKILLEKKILLIFIIFSRNGNIHSIKAIKWRIILQN